MKLPFDYEFELKEKYITKRYHQDDPDLYILNYTKKAVYERYWNNVTLSCRGLICRESTGEMVSRPFPKFFNYGESTGLPDPVLDGTPTVSCKLDGSLGISYHLNGELYWSTRGNFHSEQAQAANRIWNEKYAPISLEILENITLLVEIIDPATRNIVDYQESDLCLIGAIRTSDGYDFGYDELLSLSSIVGMKVTPQSPFGLEDLLEKRKHLPCTEEGWVLRWPNGYRLKIKGEQYLSAHRILYGVSLAKKVDVWARGKTEEWIRSLPEEFRPEIEHTFSKLDQVEHGIFQNAKCYYDRAISYSADKKEFSRFVLQHIPKPYQVYCFAFFRKKEPSIKKHIYHNYRNYISEK